MCSITRKWALAVIVSVFLAGCGGGGGSDPAPTAVTPDQPPSTGVPEPTPDPTPDPIPDPTPDPQPQPDDDIIAFDDSQVVPFSYAQRSAGLPFSANQVQSAAFGNISGSFKFPEPGQTINGNLFVSVDVSDPDGISNVFVGFDGAQNAITLCSGAENCGNRVRRTITGINPLKLNLADPSAASQTLLLFSEDTLGNQTEIRQVTIDWHPVAINGVTASRTAGAINLQWTPATNYLRYNVYLSTDNSLSVQNYQSVAISRQQLSLTGSSLNITGLTAAEDETPFYVLITGVDGGGESAFSNRLPIDPLSGPLNVAPFATNDRFEGVEDQILTGNLIANDGDADNEPVLINTIPVSTVENGELTINTDGTFAYTAPVNFSGLEQFVYQISDAAGDTAEAVVTILITPVNDTPVVLDNNYSIETTQTQLSIAAPGLLANDFDIDVDTLVVDTTPVIDPEHGEVSLQQDGSFIYTPDSDFSGEDQFTYRVIDAFGAQASGVTVINVGQNNHPPTATNDSYSINENTTLNTQQSGVSGVLANDSDTDGDPLILENEAIISPPEHGTLNLLADGHFTYLPGSNYYGVDNFIYQINDGNGGTATASVTIIIVAQNNDPVATADNYQVTEDNILSVSTDDGVLNNDADSDDDPLRVMLPLLSLPSSGTVVMNTDGSFVYTPQANFQGSDSFSYAVADPFGRSDSTSVSIVVNSVNDLPIAVNDSAVTNINTPVSIRVLDNDSDVDGDNLSITTASANNGTTVISSDTITYTPNQGFSGSDSLDYTISDGAGGSASAQVSIAINNNLNPPVAVDDSYTIVEDAALDSSSEEHPTLLANDSDPDGDALNVELTPVTFPVNGTVVLQDNGHFVYNPDSNFTGSDSFVYQINDNNGGTDTATATITITPVNDAPTAVDDAYTLSENGTLVMAVLDNDFDVDGDNITITDAAANNGVVVVLDGTSLQYQATAGFSGTDFIEYNISDNKGGTAFANVTVTISGVNDNPVAVDDVATTAEDTSIQINVLANDTDADGDNLEITAATSTNGSHQVNNDNTLTFTPTENFHGNATINYTVSDGNGGSDNAIVSITITPVNDNPTANEDFFSIEEGSSGTINPIINDTDIDGDPISISSASSNNALVTANNDNSLTYVPNANFSGTDIVSYILVDNQGGSATGIVTVTVGGVNDAPIAVNDEAQIAEDGGNITIDVLANDSDADGDTLRVITATSTNGTPQVNTDNTITFTPQSDFHGEAIINYSITDGVGGSATALVVVTVTPVNDTPVANDDVFTVDEDTTMALDPISNDTDVDGDTLSIVSATADHGIISLNSSGLTYQPDLNFNGTDTILYILSDGQGASTQGTAVVTVNPINDAPVAGADSYQINEDNTLTTGAADGVLNNDSDVDGDSLTVLASSVGQPGHGTAELLDDGSLVYIPEANFFGSDSFSYSITDPSGLTAQASVIIIVNNINDQPFAVNDSASTVINTSVTINVLLNDSDIDGDDLSIIDANAANGTTVITGDAIVYTPNTDFNGTDTINYTISDSNGATASALVSMTVNSNVAPIAVDDSYSTNEDTLLTVSSESELPTLIDNDSDPEGASLSVNTTPISEPQNGVLALNNDGTFTYTPNEHFFGSDSFVYQLIDANNGIATATATITINSVNDAPIAVDDSYSVDESGTLQMTVLDNDSDIEGDTITITAATADSGTVTVTDNTSLQYTALSDFVGTDSIEYTISDANGGTASANVTVTINKANDAPVAVDDVGQMNEDTVAAFDVLSNDTDIDGDTLTLQSAVSTNGSHEFDEGNTLTFTPNADFAGAATVTYVVSDNNGGTDTGLLSITVININDAPVANPDVATINEDTTAEFTPLDNDTDIDNEAIELSISDATANNGLVFVNGRDVLSYTPNADFHGEDIINYTVSDGLDGTAEGTISVTITSVNDLPLAIADIITIDEDTSVVMDVLDNDLDPEGDTLTITQAQSPDAAITTNPDNGFGRETLTIIPNPDFNGVAVVDYTISDGNGGTSSSTVTITVNAINDAPVVQDTSGEVSENAANGTVILTLAASDVDQDDNLTFEITAGDSLGVFTIDSPAGELSVNDATILDFETTSSYELTVTVTDAGGLTASATVSIAVQDDKENEFPVPDADFGSTQFPGLTVSNAFALDYMDTPVGSAMDSAGRVVMVGTTVDTTNSVNRIAITRYLSDGRLDNTFGVLGVFTIDLLQAELARGIAIDSADNIFIAGEIIVGTTTEIIVAKLTPDGNLDTTFGINGISSSGLGQNSLQVGDVLAHSDGSVFVAARVNDEFGVFKYDAQGALVSSVSVNVTGDFDQPEALAEQPDGRVIVGGHAADAASGFTYDFAAARLLNTVPLTLDTSFGSSGITTFDLGQSKSDMLHDIDIQANGDIVLVGSFLVDTGIFDVAVATLDGNGVLQSSFGTGGILLVDADGDAGANTGSSFATSLDIDASGNLFIGIQVGLTPDAYDYGVLKISVSGLPDTSFGNNGVTTHDLGGQNTTVGLMLDAQNRPVMATSIHGINHQDFALTRFTSTGGFDGSFLNFGYNKANQTPSFDTMHGGIEMLVTPHNGKLVMIGETNSSSGITDMLIARYNPDGSIDATFAMNGYFHLSANDSNTAYVAKSVIETSDGRLVVTGSFAGTSGFLMMLDGNGNLDASFAGGNGIELIPADGQTLILNSVDIDNNGKIVVAGTALNTTTDIYLARFNLDGGFDNTFGSGGRVSLELTSNTSEVANRVVPLTDNSLIVVGKQNNNALIAKVLTTGALDSSFNGGNGFQSLDVNAGVSDNNDELFDVAIDAGGNIYASGGSNGSTTDFLTVIALHGNGDLRADFARNFGPDGIGLYEFGSGHAAESLTIDQAGNLLLTGHTHGASEDDMFVARLLPDGTLDPLFNSGNHVLFNITPTDSSEVVIAMQDGRILIAGHNQIANFPPRAWYLLMLKLTAVAARPAEVVIIDDNRVNIQKVEGRR